MPLTKLVLRFGMPIFLVLPLLMVGCGEQEQQSEEQKQAPEVGVVTLQAQKVELFTELPGRTSPYRVAEVRPQVDGIIQKRLFEEGGRVQAGQTLYQVDPKPYRAVYDSAKADLASARAAVTSVQSRERRFSELLQDNAVSEQEYDDISSTLEQNKAQVAVAQAAVDSARINLDYTRVKSPIDGIIGQSFITEGGLVTANQADPLAQVTQLDPIYVDISRSTAQLTRLKKEFKDGSLENAGPEQAEVDLILQDDSVYERIGALKFTGVTVDPSTGSITLRAVFPNPDNTLLPGMFVRAKLSEGVKSQAILVPQQGVTRDAQGEATALVVTQDNKVKKRALETSRTIDSFWLVSKGLEAGDKVIVTGLHHAKVNSEVKPVAAEIDNKPGPQTLKAREGAPSEDSSSDDSSTQSPQASQDASSKSQQGSPTDG